LTKVVVLGLPLNWTTELLLKFVPLTVNVNAGSPANLPVGETLVNVGTGLLIVNVSAGVEVPPAGAGLVTVTATAPPVKTSEAAIWVVNCEALTNVAGWFVAPKLIDAPLTKLLPLTVRVNSGSPAVTLDGERLLVIGNGLLTVKFNAGVDVPPPGAGLVTVTVLDPPTWISPVSI